MTGSLLYAGGTLALWAGIWLTLLGIGNALRNRVSRTPMLGLGAGIGLVTLGFLATRPDAKQTTFNLPLLWPVMSFWHWLMAASIAFAAVRIVQSLSALSKIERNERLGAAGIWLLVGLFAFGLNKQLDGGKIEMLRGRLPLTPTVLIVFAVLAVGTILIMAAMGRDNRTRERATALGAHAALLTGVVIFGIPFAFLLITSFKEDRDMSSANGIVWIPKVQRTVPYFDPKNPLFQTTYQGQAVEGTIIEELPDDTVRIDIAKPLAIRGTTVVIERSKIKEIPRDAPLFTGTLNGVAVSGKVIENFDDGSKRLEVIAPVSLKGQVQTYAPTELEPIRDPGLRWQNYPEALSYMPPETHMGLVYLKNTLILVVLSVLGTLLSSSVVAYAFSRLKFPGRDFLFGVLLSTLMLPAAVTLLPQFLIFKQFGWIDSLLPIWVPAFLGSAFNIFLLRQFFLGIPMELEDAAKMDGCSYLRSFWSVMMPQMKPALAVVAIWTFMGAWNNFIGPLIYVNSPENMPISYALQLFQSDRGLGEPGLLMAFASLTMIPVLALFFFAQKYFIEGVSLSGLGGR